MFKHSGGRDHHRNKASREGPFKYVSDFENPQHESDEASDHRSDSKIEPIPQEPSLYSRHCGEALDLRISRSSCPQRGRPRKAQARTLTQGLNPLVIDQCACNAE